MTANAETVSASDLDQEAVAAAASGGPGASHDAGSIEHSSVDENGIDESGAVEVDEVLVEEVSIDGLCGVY